MVLVLFCGSNCLPPWRDILFVQSLVAYQWFLALPCYLLHHIKCQLAELFRGTLTFLFETPPWAGREQCLVEAFSASHILGSTLYLKSRSPIWWLMSVMSLLGKLRQEDSCEFEASLGNIARLCLKVKQMDKKKKKERNLVMGNRLSTSDVPSELGKPCLEGRASDSYRIPPSAVTLGVGALRRAFTAISRCCWHARSVRQREIEDTEMQAWEDFIE